MSKKKNNKVVLEKENLKNIAAIEAIKEKEKEIRSTIHEKVIEKTVDTVTFNAWWMLRCKKINKAHRKEVIWADFKGRGLKNAELIETFDSALTKYGIIL